MTSNILYDSIYRCVKLSPLSYKIIESPIFARLKNIKQLGALEFVFPTGNHTRYQHSIGVAYLSKLCAQNLKDNHPEYKITDDDVLQVELAGLLHDIGHGPYSHVFDRVLKKNNQKDDVDYLDHEYRSQVLVKHILKDILSEEDIKIVQFYIDPSDLTEFEMTDKIRLLSQIVSNKIHFIDTDKLDYLIRDSYYLGADSFMRSDISTKDIVSRMRILKDNDKDILAFDIKDYGSIYDLMCRRLIFHTNKYSCPSVTASSEMVEDILSYCIHLDLFDCVSLKTEEDIKNFCKLDDNILFTVKLPDTIYKILEDLCKGNFYKFLGDVITKDLDRNIFAPVKRTVFTDKSSPLNSLPKLVYHSNGQKIDPSKVDLYQLFLKDY